MTSDVDARIWIYLGVTKIKKLRTYFMSHLKENKDHVMKNNYQSIEIPWRSRDEIPLKLPHATGLGF